MDVSHLAVLLSFLLLVVVVAVRQWCVVVFVSVPMRSVLPLTQWTPLMVMRNVVVVVSVGLRGMGVLGLLEFRCSTLLYHGE
jgi:hypothetical protein